MANFYTFAYQTHLSAARNTSRRGELVLRASLLKMCLFPDSCGTPQNMLSKAVHPRFALGRLTPPTLARSSMRGLTLAWTMLP